MAKYLINSNDIEIEEVSGTENLKFNLADGNAVEQKIGDLSNLTTTNKSNIVNAINEVNGNLTNLNTYSTTETVIGKWLGKPLYRKVIDIGNLPNSDTKTINHGISNIDIITKFYGIANNLTNSIPIPYFYPNSNYVNYGVGVECGNRNSISIITGTNRSSYNGYVVLEYTKN